MVALLLQIDPVEIAGRDWTTVSLAVFCLVAGGLLAVGLYWHQQKIIKHLAGDKREIEKGWREDLQKQVAQRGQDGARVEGALQTSASATSALQAEVQTLRSRVDALLDRAPRRGGD